MECSKWIYQNITCQWKIKKFELEWNVAFAVICWKIWLGWNKTVFDGKYMWHSTTDSLLKSHLVEAAYYLKKQRTSLKHEELIGWKPPPSEFIKVNVDGSTKGSPGLSAADGACRDSAGQWLFGFTQQLGEGHAIRTG
ncbi:hypothetical protein SLA2020_256330 [Shorea laevis]